jgi:hypothetical protein
LRGYPANIFELGAGRDHRGWMGGGLMNWMDPTFRTILVIVFVITAVALAVLGIVLTWSGDT